MSQRRIGVVLFNMGGPDSMDAIEPFLFNLFRDEDIIQLPGGRFYQNALANLIASKRAPKVADDYEHIGGKSPLKEQTWEQAKALESRLNAAHGDIEFTCLVAMRYWHPFTEEAVQSLQEKGITEVLLLSLYPHYARATTGSSLKEWQRVVTEWNATFDTSVICAYPTEPSYISFMVEQIKESIATIPEGFDPAEAHIVFSPHGLPQAYVDQGDPYEKQIRATAAAIMEHFDQPHHVAFQSQVGPIKWLEPKTPAVLEELAHKGVETTVVVPIAFVSEHIETLYEIDVEFGDEAREAGIKNFIRVPAAGAHPRFIDVLENVTESYLARPHKGFTCHGNPDGECCSKLQNKQCCHDLHNWYVENDRRELAPQSHETSDETKDTVGV